MTVGLHDTICMGHTSQLQLDMVVTMLNQNVLYKVDDDGNNVYYAGFEYKINTYECSWSLYQPVLIPDDELDDCIRDIREYYTVTLYVSKINLIQTKEV